MFIFRMIGFFAKMGGKIAKWYGNFIEFADYLIHKKEYERRAKRRKLFWGILFAILGTIVVVLLFPYRLKVKKNGDFEIRTLLLRVYRKSDDQDGLKKA